MPRYKPNNYWSPKYRIMTCLVCWTNERPHNAKGMCSRCLGRWRWKNDEKWKARTMSLTAAWRKNNPDKWKAIMRKASKRFNKS